MSQREEIEAEITAAHDELNRTLARLLATSARAEDAAAAEVDNGHDGIARLYHAAKSRLDDAAAHTDASTTLTAEASELVRLTKGLPLLAIGTGSTPPSLSTPVSRNIARFTRKLPSGALPPVVIPGPHGHQLLSKVPGRVPGSYAVYSKHVDHDGVTTRYWKTTVTPDGSIAHVKDKLT